MVERGTGRDGSVRAGTVRDRGGAPRERIRRSSDAPGRSTDDAQFRSGHGW
ncbi:hypothetical protein GJ633_12640 [Halorubrum sp. CBA1125]|nr:hypothetical protein [Halorubrum sp. CBA1125]